MADSAETHLQALERGLKALGKERRVVLSHHHSFELIEEMQRHLTQLRPYCQPPVVSEAAKQKKTDATSKKTAPKSKKS